MKCNYHTHTSRCMHAEGSDESYVRAAVAAGFDVLGFSDHVPFPFVSGFVSRIRMTMDELDGYIDSVASLKEKYAGTLLIHTGFEAEYFPRYTDHLKYLLDTKADYLILGQHYIGSEEDSPYVGRACLDDDFVLRYAEATAQGIRSGLFAYVAHPDLMMRDRTDAAFTLACEQAADMICQAACETGLPIEFNLLGYSQQLRGRNCGYPSPAFWRYAKKWQNRAIIGVDAHNPLLLRDAALWREGSAFLESLGYEVVDHLSFDN